jgi:predicted ATPase
MTFEKSIYIITGGPGFGKTMLVEALKADNYLCSDEYARDLILAQQELGGEILPWKKPRLFQQEILRKRIAFFDSVPPDAVAFADRAIPDQLAFARYKGFGAPEILVEAAKQYRYASTVFVTPPWPEIFMNDPIRTETFEEAKIIHQIIVDTYKDLNYQINELPLLPLSERKKHILQNLLNIEY